ncbi:GNAT family N-acetyltransferase [archaeon]|nr:GNAT family N-acetyltransferase [archaeon]
MKFKLETKQSKAIRISLLDDSGKEVARAFMFLITNDLHEGPYALLEDVFVNEEFRGQGLGKQIVKKAVEEAKSLGCYKIIGTSRNLREKVHEFYRLLGFEEYGKEFRMNL